ncbi:hypothetical protein [Pseudohoeflea coraliihabitans]|uniref:Lipoprotein n=1 Tax=Pseudohoeflea coraliihabitans TaxID=2860393 RepID=A0ABS6WMB3_9HYPH|nr:hypothetical protein [Pseudohoeflea sp. DP4N28-3]MBW3097099.1 hypothetical protein [Pseudohoeflea sp. DP4N28-3]
MQIDTGQRAALRAALLVAMAMSVTACLGPTYGTDKTATEQLVEDVSNMATIKRPKNTGVAYTPRPAIVRPPETAVLPEPQRSVSEDNPAWVEAPEETRARLVAEADANPQSQTYRSPLARKSTVSSSGPRKVGASIRAQEAGPSSVDLVRAKQEEDRFRENLKVNKGAYTDRRRFLSDPPVDYRQPAQTAAAGDVGKSEREKERERIAAAKREKSGGWFKIPLPW